jgi:hyaluronan synthase
LLAYAFLAIPLLHGELYWQPIIYWLALLYAMSGHYLIRRPYLSFRERFISWAMTPLLIPLQMFVVRPAMYYAMTQAGNDGWRTR